MSGYTAKPRLLLAIGIHLDSIMIVSMYLNDLMAPLVSMTFFNTIFLRKHGDNYHLTLGDIQSRHLHLDTPIRFTFWVAMMEVTGLTFTNIICRLKGGGQFLLEVDLHVPVTEQLAHFMVPGI